MNYIHIKNLEKFHPKYKDRTLQWAKIYFKMIQGDPETEMLHEIDRGRLISFILLELQAKEPIPNNDEYFRRKGFAIEIRPMSLTIEMLHNFILVVTELQRYDYVDKEKEEDKDKEKEVCNNLSVTPIDFIQTLKENKAYSHINIEQELGKMDAWLLTRPGRQKTKRFIVNWLNKIETPLPITTKNKPQPDYKAPKGERHKFIPPRKEIRELIKGIG